MDDQRLYVRRQALAAFFLLASVSSIVLTMHFGETAFVVAAIAALFAATATAWVGREAHRMALLTAPCETPTTLPPWGVARSESAPANVPVEPGGGQTMLVQEAASFESVASDDPPWSDAEGEPRPVGAHSETGGRFFPTRKTPWVTANAWLSLAEPPARWRCVDHQQRQYEELAVLISVLRQLGFTPDEATQRAVQLLKRQRRPGHASDDELEYLHLPIDGKSPHKIRELATRTRQIVEVISSLSSKSRALFLAKYRDGSEFEAIAAEFNMTPPEVKRQTAKVRHKIARELGSDIDTYEDPPSSAVPST